MKRLKNLFVTIILFTTLLSLSACQGTMHEEPQIEISYNSEELNAIYYFNMKNEEERDIERGVKDVMVGKRFIDLPTVDFGKKIAVKTLNFESAEMEIYDYIVDERGNIISDYDVEPITIISVEGGKAEFIFEKDDYLERYDKYKVEGKAIHLLLIRCEIYNSSFAFGTLVLGGN
jgi:hypothetical protein